MSRRGALTVALLVVVLAGACGDDSGEPSAPDTTEASTVASHCEAVEAYAAEVEEAGDDLTEAEVDAFVDRYQDLQAENRTLDTEERTPAEFDELLRCTDIVAAARLDLPD